MIRKKRNPCDQLRGELYSQNVLLKSFESKKSRAEIQIAKLNEAIANTRKKLVERGCTQQNDGINNPADKTGDRKTDK